MLSRGHIVMTDLYEIDLSDYLVSATGAIYYRGERVKTFKNNRGYDTVRIKGENDPVQVHRIIARLYCKRCPGCQCVDHINGDKNDNRADNLEWVTFKENERRKRARTEKAAAKLLDDIEEHKENERRKEKE